MKILFLDIDGVLNSRHFFLTRKEKEDDPFTAEIEALADQLADLIPSTQPLPRKRLLEVVSMDFRNLDRASIVLLNDILDRSGAKIVVSSTWRFGHTIEGLAILLKAKGLVGEVIGKTPELRGDLMVRGHEIQAWLDEHSEVTSFVILDDDNDMAHLDVRLVRTAFQTGITQGDVERALALLSQPAR